MDLAGTFSRINPYNYASLYMLKHGLGELVALRNKLQGKVNFLGHPDWNAFCSCEDYEKSGRILKTLAQKCEQNF